MNKLHKYAFSDLYNISSGISTSKSQAGHGAPFVSFSTVFNNYFLPDELPDLMDTSEHEQETYSIKKGDILITRTSETVDELAMSCVALKDYPKATYSGFTKRLRPKVMGVTYDKFMAFYLRSKYFRRVINCNTIMTLRASFNEDIFSFLYLYLPDYEIQVKIGDFLYNIERKIQIHNRINDNLQRMAKTIYDYWFTQFDFPNENGKPYRSSGGKLVWNEQLGRNIPRGWEVTSISTYTDIYQPKTISNDLLDDNYEYYVYGGGGYIGRYQEYNHKESEVILSCRGNCGNVYMSMPYSWITGNAMVIHPSNHKLTKEYIYHFVQSYGVEKYISGSVQKQLTRENLSLMPIIVPEKKVLQQFEELIKPYRLRQFQISYENDELKNLRDWLLPMLMNGQAIITD